MKRSDRDRFRVFHFVPFFLRFFCFGRVVSRFFVDAAGWLEDVSVCDERRQLQWATRWQWSTAAAQRRPAHHHVWPDRSRHGTHRWPRPYSSRPRRPQRPSVAVTPSQGLSITCCYERLYSPEIWSRYLFRFAGILKKLRWNLREVITITQPIKWLHFGRNWNTETRMTENSNRRQLVLPRCQTDADA